MPDPATAMPPCPGGVETWIFDLDNTLYHPSARLFDQINARMTGFIMRELGVGRARADDLRGRYWRRYGITLKGLIDHHDIDAEKFLAEVHDLDLAVLQPDPELAAAIGALKGRKIVHTNGPRIHAEAVLEARGLSGLFERVFAIEDKAFIPKPQAEAYRIVLDAAAIDPTKAAMIEDDARNLTVPKALGMATVWLDHGADGPMPDWVDQRITCLSAFLAGQD